MESRTDGEAPELDGLAGELAPGLLIDLFRQVAGSGQVGTLYVNGALECHELFFRDGGVQNQVTRRMRSQRLGQRLLMAGQITDDQLQTALEEQCGDYQPLGQILVNLGFVTAAQLEEVAQYHASEELLTLLTWRSGTYEFVEGDGTDPMDEARREAMPEFECSDVLEEASRRVEQWDRILATIGSVDEIIVPSGGGKGEAVDLDHTMILHALDGERRICDLPDATGLALFDCALFAAELCERNIVSVASPEHMLEVAAGIVEGGERPRAAALLETLVARPDFSTPGLLRQTAEMLKDCAKPRAAAGALLKAADNSDGDERLGLARAAADLDAGSVEARRLLADELAAGGGKDEAFQASLGLIDAMASADDAEGALAHLSRLEHGGSPAELIEVLSRRARLLSRGGVHADAVDTLLQLADILAQEGDTEREVSVLEQVLAIDPKNRVAAKRVRAARRPRPSGRLPVVVASVAALAILGVAGTVYFDSARDGRIAETVARINAQIARGEWEVARRTLDRAVGEDGEQSAYAKLRDKMRARVTEQQQLQRQRLEQQAYEKLRGVEDLVGKREFAAALDGFGELLELPIETDRVRDIVKARFAEVTGRFQTLGMELAVAVPKSVDMDAGQAVRAAQLASLDQRFKHEDRDEARQILELQKHPVLPEFLDDADRIRMQRAARKVLDAFEQAEAVRSRIIALSDPLIGSAVNHDRALDFRAALKDYEQLNEKYPWATRFRHEYERHQLIVAGLDAVERATKASDFNAATRALEKFAEQFPDLPVGKLISLPLRIDTVPRGAKVVLNDEDVGRTPLDISYPADGTVTMRIELDGFVTESLKFAPGAGGAVRRELIKAHDWTASLSGRVEEPPAFAGRSAYVSDRSGNVFAIDSSTGFVRWKFESDDLSGLLPEPAVAGDHVFVASFDGELRALERRTGKLAWSASNLACEAAPTVAGSVLVVPTTAGEAVLIDYKRLRELRRVRLPGAVRHGAIGVGRTAIIATTTGVVLRLDAHRGKILWQKQIGQGFSVRPLVDANRVIAVTELGSVAALRLDDGVEEWRWGSTGNIDLPPAILGSRLFVIDGRVIHSLSLQDGSVGPKLPGKTEWAGGLSARDGKLLAGTRSGDVLVLDAATLALRYRIRGKGRLTCPIVFDPDGRALAFFGSRNVLGFLRLP